LPWKKSAVSRNYTGDVEDAELAAEAAGGNAAAFHALTDRHADRLFRLAVALVGNSTDAEDVLQESLIGAFRGLKSFQGRSSVKTWLTRILVNQAARFRRGKRKVEAITESQPATRDGAAGVEAKIDVRAALADLSAEHRQVIVLRELEKMSYDEIADVLEVPQGTVESRLNRARAALREKLKSYLV
jgi:RNA polymerase sigma-70 factor, ECF subfamily